MFPHLWGCLFQHWLLFPLSLHLRKRRRGYFLKKHVSIPVSMAFSALCCMSLECNPKIEKLSHHGSPTEEILNSILMQSSLIFFHHVNRVIIERKAFMEFHFWNLNPNPNPKIPLQCSAEVPSTSTPTHPLPSKNKERMGHHIATLVSGHLATNHLAAKEPPCHQPTHHQATN